jgi:hypothetical protein
LCGIPSRGARRLRILRSSWGFTGTVSDENVRTVKWIYGGWPMVLSGLKTLLETGEMLTTPGSLRWSQPPKPAA